MALPGPDGNPAAGEFSEQIRKMFTAARIEGRGTGLTG